MTRQKHRTAEDQQRRQAEPEEWTAVLLQQLEAGVAAFSTGDDCKRYLATAARFHQYLHANGRLTGTKAALPVSPEASRAWCYDTGRATCHTIDAAIPHERSP